MNKVRGPNLFREPLKCILELSSDDICDVVQLLQDDICSTFENVTFAFSNIRAEDGLVIYSVRYLSAIAVNFRTFCRATLPIPRSSMAWS